MNKRIGRIVLPCVLGLVAVLFVLALVGCGGEAVIEQAQVLRARGTQHTFHSEVVTNANGTAMWVDSYPTLGIQVVGITNATVSFAGTIDGSNWVAVEVVNVATGAKATSTTADGIFRLPVGDIRKVRCPISSWVGGTITVKGNAPAEAGFGLEDVEVSSVTTGTIQVDDGGNVLSVDDGAGSLTVDDGATSLTIDASELVTIAGAVTGSEMQVDIVADGAGLATSAKQLADGHNVAVASIAAGETHIGEVGTNSDVISVTLTLSPTTYADGDVLADTQALTDIMRVNAGTGIPYSVAVIDLDDQAQALDILFLDTNCSIGTEDSAVSIADSCADDILCVVEIASGDYVDLINSQVAMGSPACVVESTAGINELWFAVVSRGTGTYTASGIVCKFGFLRD